MKKQLGLIVDEQPKVLRFVEIDLKLHGFEVIKTTSGEEAINLVRSQKPHIMLLDIVMPGMDGLEVLRQLRAFSTIPVIAFSARAENHDDALRCGADDFMTKPFLPDYMLSRIRMLLHQKTML